MEQFHQGNEQNEPEKQILRLNLDREKPFETTVKVVSSASVLLEGEELQDFKNRLEWAWTTKPESGKGYGDIYDDILAITNSYIRLVDTSGTHPDYVEGAQD